ncbi:hypothetical protein CUMW_248400 [Citrus unshiu]|uniref:Uncharacterized protein n=1 Tax=Citrus unshiu TaxID=55188 RepID=A0A2H5QP48_CITUN|nr:hypothetical protein CUMW_248400 [Citrus unshiu]
MNNEDLASLHRSAPSRENKTVLFRNLCSHYEPKNAVFVNGKFCKDPKLARPEYFFLSGLDKPGTQQTDLVSV